VYNFTTHNANIAVPFNLHRTVLTDTNTASYSLYKIFSLNVGAIIDVDALMIYSDGSRRWIKSSVFAQHFTKAYMARTEINMITSENTMADEDKGAFSLDGTDIVLNSDFICDSIILVVRFNTTGRPLFN
jgi:hypothetical protein